MMSKEEELDFDDEKEVLVHIAQKLDKIEEIGRNTQIEIILIRKDFLKFVKTIIVLAILAICVLAEGRLAFQ